MKSINKKYHLLRLLLLIALVSVAALLFKILYFWSKSYSPERNQVSTFTGIRFIDKQMFIWPLLAMIALYFQDHDSKTIQRN